MQNNKECMVSVFCTTYNQKKYISKCLDSLVSQKTDFPYEIIVRDDASTDGTSDIVREYHDKYPDRIVPFIQEENLFQRGLSYVSFEKMFNMSRGKYIAVCEGDDYWTDECKLQKQVDFMESHPDYSLCGHAAYYATEDGELLSDRFFRLERGAGDLSTEEIINNWSMATGSLMYRKSSRTDVIVPFKGKCINGDYALLVYLALKGKVYYSDELMSAYRLCSNGSISQRAKKDPEFLKKNRLEYAAMLDRIDSYTEGRYSDVLTARKRKTLFDLYLNTGDGKSLKQYKDVLGTVSFRTKLKYLLCVYCNPAIRILKRIRK